MGWDIIVVAPLQRMDGRMMGRLPSICPLNFILRLDRWGSAVWTAACLEVMEVLVYGAASPLSQGLRFPGRYVSTVVQQWHFTLHFSGWNELSVVPHLCLSIWLPVQNWIIVERVVNLIFQWLSMRSRVASVSSRYVDV